MKNTSTCASFKIPGMSPFDLCRQPLQLTMTPVKKLSEICNGGSVAPGGLTGHMAPGGLTGHMAPGGLTGQAGSPGLPAEVAASFSQSTGQCQGLYSVNKTWLEPIIVFTVGYCRL